MPQQQSHETPNDGFVDLHCHLLPAVDDGAKDLAESLAMARALAQAGFSAVAPSPHAWIDAPDAVATGQRRQELQAALDREGIPLSLHQNAENPLDEELFARLGRGDVRTLGSGRFILVEAPFDSPLPSLLDLIFRLKIKGLHPLFAHPERCHEFANNPRRGREAVDAGALLQMELGAPIGRYGKAARKVAERLLAEDLYAVAATDLHGPAGADRWIPEAIEALIDRVGVERGRRLIGDNPRRLLRGESLEVEAR
jgi:protein-tyrosine phosphatase